MKEYERVISRDSSRKLIAVSDVNKRDIPALVFFLDRLIGRVSPDSNLINIFLSVLPKVKRRSFCRKVLKMNFKSLEIEELPEIIKADEFSINCAAKAISESLSGVDRKKKTAVTNLMLTTFVENFAGKTFKDDILRKSLELKEMIDITDEEAQFIYAAYISQMCIESTNIIHECEFQKHCALLAVLSGLSQSRVKQLLDQKNKLIQMEYLEHDYLPPHQWTIRNDIKNFLAHKDVEFYSEARLFEDRISTFKINDFPYSRTELSLASNILTGSGPANILLHGEPGTGKTELSMVLAQDAGVKARFLKIDKENDAAASTMRTALVLAAKTAEIENFILIVDEADSILNSERMVFDGLEKAWIVNFMDKHHGKIIWITNSIKEVHPAVARRFSFNLKFERFRTNQRKTIIKNLLESNPVESILSSEVIESVCSDYNINAGGISTSLQTMAQLNPEKEQAENVLRMLLKQHEALTTPKKIPGSLKKISKDYNPEFINADTDITKLTSGIHQYFSESPALPLALLFQGEPGTGKTEFAKYLSAATDRPLIVKRSSDLISKWVGDTEKEIAAAFCEAEKENAILLLDEADSFFIDRSSAQYSWEKSQTNELLTQMENFKGVLICCTNFIDSLDHAVLRRFTKKISFTPPKTENLPEIFRSFFPKAKLHDLQLHRLKAFEGLTPGDFFTVKHSLAFISPNLSCTEEIINELETEYSYKRKTKVVGF